MRPGEESGSDAGEQVVGEAGIFGFGELVDGVPLALEQVLVGREVVERALDEEAELGVAADVAEVQVAGDLAPLGAEVLEEAVDEGLVADLGASTRRWPAATRASTP